MSNLLEHERQIRYLERVIARGRLSHAYLFYGPDEAGMLVVARAVAKCLVCPNYRGEASIVGAGDGCRDCLQIDAGTNLFAILLDVEHPLIPSKEGRKEISIDDIHELRRLFALAPAGNRWRVAILNQVDKMSREAADAFLKLLEEPGTQTLFILIAPARELLSPTIVSRTVPIRFSGQPEPRIPADEKIRAAVRNALERGIPEALALADQVASDRDLRSRATRALIGYLRAKLHAASSGERLRLARRIGRALDLTDSLESTNINPRLALDVLLIESIVL